MQWVIGSPPSLPRPLHPIPAESALAPLHVCTPRTCGHFLRACHYHRICVSPQLRVSLSACCLLRVVCCVAWYAGSSCSYLDVTFPDLFAKTPDWMRTEPGAISFASTSYAVPALQSAAATWYTTELAVARVKPLLADQYNMVWCPSHCCYVRWGGGGGNRNCGQHHKIPSSG